MEVNFAKMIVAVLVAYYLVAVPTSTAWSMRMKQATMRTLADSTAYIVTIPKIVSVIVTKP